MPPRLQVVYCLTSQGRDIYEAMTRISLATARKCNQGAYISIICDERTYQDLKLAKSRLFYEADDVIPIATPAGEPEFRNRFLKTRLRLLVKGNFLFLDSDTVIRKPLTELCGIKADIAAAPNHSADSMSDQIWSEDYAIFEKMQWPQPTSPYFNGGVVWYADTPATHLFAEIWHDNWLKNIRGTGRFRDQPALNHSLQTTPELNVFCLDHRWNAQVKTPQGLAYASTANIWHIYSSFDIASLDLFSVCRSRLKHNQPLKQSSRIVKRLTTADSPFISTESSFTWKHRLAVMLKGQLP